MTTAKMLELVASYEVISGAEKHVPALQGIVPHFTEQQRGEARKILNQYARIKKRLARDLGNQLSERGDQQ